MLLSLAALTMMGAAVAIASAAATEPEDLARTQMGALIMQHESDGGRNIPNHRFDRRHTAGGRFQIVDTTWKRYAPQAGLSLEQYPNALSAPEQLQGQVAGLIFAHEGYMPWTCCNPSLKAAVTAPRLPPKPSPSETAKPEKLPPAIIEAKAPRNWNIFADPVDHSMFAQR